MKYLSILLICFFVGSNCLGQKVDSTKYYWKKYNYYKHRMNVELERINKFQNPTITKDLFRYEDSTKKYHELLNRLKSK